MLYSDACWWSCSWGCDDFEVGMVNLKWFGGAEGIDWGSALGGQECMGGV